MAADLILAYARDPDALARAAAATRALAAEVFDMTKYVAALDALGAQAGNTAAEDQMMTAPAVVTTLAVTRESTAKITGGETGDGVGEVEDLVEIVERLRLFELGHHQSPAVRDRLGLRHIRRALDEGEADIVDAQRQDELQIREVFFGEGGDRQHDVRNVDALAVRQRPSIHDFGEQMVVALAHDSEAQFAVIEQQGRADFGRRHDFRMRQADPAGVAGGRIHVEREFLPGL